MKRTLLPITLALVIGLAVATASGQAQHPSVYSLHEMPVGATLHTVIAAPAEYKGRKALKVEFTEAANKSPPGVDFLIDMPTFVLIPTNFKNGTIEVDILGRLNGKGSAGGESVRRPRIPRCRRRSALRIDLSAAAQWPKDKPSLSTRQARDPVLRLSGLEIRPTAQGVPRRTLRVRGGHCRR
jgi:hypothetical protein